MSAETVEQAWKRLFGTAFDREREICRFFHLGLNAGRGHA